MDNTKLIASAKIIRQNPTRFSIEGRVDFSTVPDLLKQAQTYLKALDSGKSKQAVFDLSQTESCDSAALALMLEIVKTGKQANLNLQFDNMPNSLSQIAKAYGIETEIRDFFR